MLRASRVLCSLKGRGMSIVSLRDVRIINSKSGLHTSRCLSKAEFFRMPAMSPTMEKGGVTDWKFKEGDSFSSGEVLLEVETDKSSIDVEAQDDGILAKILIQNGASDIPVGTPIAVIAEPGDDLASLELPKDESAAKEIKQAPSSAPAPTPTSKKETQKPSTPVASEGVSQDANPKQVFFPSVASLLSENSISREDAISKIKATGAQGRLLKGDVLAYLGKISQESVNSIAAFINKNTKLDLSNIEKLKITPKEPKEAKSDAPAKAKQAKPETKKVTKSFNLESVLSLLESKGNKFTLQQFIEKASRDAERYAYQPHPKQSDYYDAVFEEIVAPSSNVDRFSVKLNIPKQNKKASSPLDDLFDEVVAPSIPELTVEVTINPRVIDAEEKANLYLEKLQQYL